MDVVVDPTSGPPGTSIHYSGHCDLGGVATDVVYVKGYLYNPPPGMSVIFDTLDEVASDATFEGTLVVPSDAPPGRYVVSSACFTTDVGYGKAETDFTVTDEPAITTTSTSTSTTTNSIGVTTSTTAAAGGSSPNRRSASSPAPVAGSARYTG
jgi:hypothetical protein